MSQDALGEQLGISGATVHLFEAGAIDPAESLAAIAAATGRPLGWFTDEVVDESALPEPELAAEPEPVAVAEPEPGAAEPELEPQPVLEAEALNPQPALEEAAEPKPAPRARARRRTRRPEPVLEAEALNPQPALEEAVEPKPAPRARAPRRTRRPEPVPEAEALNPQPALEEAVEPKPPPRARAPRRTRRPRAPAAAARACRHHLSGNTMIVDTPEGAHIRVIASRDDSGRYVSEYELMTVENWQGKPRSVWRPTQDYRTRSGVTVDECLEASLAEIEAGPRPPEESPAETPAEGEPAAEEAAPGKPRRGILGILRRSP